MKFGKRKPTQEPLVRSNVVSIRLNPGEGDGMVRAAERANRTVGEWLREVARAAVERSDRVAAHEGDK